jgi:protocatechuate 3,4-dioxygenase beta subunit
MPDIVSVRWSLLACSVGVVALAACGGTTEPPAPAAITVTPATLSFSARGATKQLTAAVTDQHGNALPNATVTWSSNNTAVATVTSSGLVASVGNGTTQIVAAAGPASTQVTVTVAQGVFTLQKTGGDNQSAAVGTQLPQALAVQVTDSLGNPVPNATVSFSVTSGGGGVSPLSAFTDASGNASTRWTIGTSTTVQQRVTASSAPATAAVFSATATAGPPQTAAKQAGDNQLAATGTAVAIKPAVLVRDQYGNPVSNTTVTFAPGANSGTVTGGTVQTTAAGVATVGGWTVNGTPGTDTLIATVTGSGITGNPARFLATVKTPGPPASVVVQAGDAQNALVGYAVNVPPAVLVRDTGSLPVANATVTFAVGSGGGSVTGATVTTGSDGVATVGSWTVGSTAATNTLTATVTGGSITGNPVTFTVSGVNAGYKIDVRYLTSVTAPRKVAFDSAAAFWMRAIYGALDPIALNIGANTCFSGQPAMNETVPDIVIFVQLDSIDGPGKILGEAGPCYIRSISKLPIMGLIRLDTADVQILQNNNQLNVVVRHEMGHVLGFGTIWSCDQFGLCLLAGPVSQGGADPHFIGSQALAAFDRIGGMSYTGGAKVPVENVGGIGSTDGHWRESVFGNELMTSILNAGANPLSVLSIASMGDEGYTVNYAAADPYSHIFSLLAGASAAARAVHLENDILSLPIRVVDRTGRVIGVRR